MLGAERKRSAQVSRNAVSKTPRFMSTPPPKADENLSGAQCLKLAKKRHCDFAEKGTVHSGKE